MLVRSIIEVYLKILAFDLDLLCHDNSEIYGYHSYNNIIIFYP